MNYSEYRRRKARRRTYAFWKQVEETVLMAIGVFLLMGFFIAWPFILVHFGG